MTDEKMDDDEDAGGQPSSSSGLLSPRRIEAIHIAFNNVFDNATKEGLIRDASTYPSFDDIYEITLRRQNGEQIDEEELLGPITRYDIMQTGDMDVDTHNEGESHLENTTKERGVQVIHNSQESVAQDMIFSDEEHPQKVVNTQKRKRSQPPQKRTIDPIDGNSPPTSLIQILKSLPIQKNLEEFVTQIHQ
jgi:hypothetical protein